MGSRQMSTLNRDTPLSTAKKILPIISDISEIVQDRR